MLGKSRMMMIKRKIYVGEPDKLSREIFLSLGLDGGKRCDADVDVSFSYRLHSAF